VLGITAQTGRSDMTGRDSVTHLRSESILVGTDSIKWVKGWFDHWRSTHTFNIELPHHVGRGEDNVGCRLGDTSTPKEIISQKSSGLDG